MDTRKIVLDKLKKNFQSHKFPLDPHGKCFICPISNANADDMWPCDCEFRLSYLQHLHELDELSCKIRIQNMFKLCMNTLMETE